MTVRKIDVGVLETKPNGVEVYVADDGEQVWKDTYPTGAIDAAWYGEDKYDDAEELDERPSGVQWRTVELLDGGGVWYARFEDEAVQGEMGDMPGEAVMYLDLNDKSSSEPLTTAGVLHEQVVEILSSNISDLFESEGVWWLVNEDALGRSVDVEEVESILEGLAIDPAASVERYEESDTLYHDGSRS